jgi:hypothetical protein
MAPSDAHMTDMKRNSVTLEDAPPFVREEIGRVRLMFGIRQEILPMGVVTLSDGKAAILPMDFSDEDAKMEAFAVLRLACKKTHATRATFVSEAWSAVAETKEQAEMMRPSKAPHRIECVVMTVDDAKTGPWSVQMEILRPDGEPADLGEPRIFRAAGGRISRLLPDEERAN